MFSGGVRAPPDRQRQRPQRGGVRTVGGAASQGGAAASHRVGYHGNRTALLPVLCICFLFPEGTTSRPQVSSGSGEPSLPAEPAGTGSPPAGQGVHEGPRTSCREGRSGVGGHRGSLGQHQSLSEAAQSRPNVISAQCFLFPQEVAEYYERHGAGSPQRWETPPVIEDLKVGRVSSWETSEDT